MSNDLELALLGKIKTRKYSVDVRYVDGTNTIKHYSWSGDKMPKPAKILKVIAYVTFVKVPKLIFNFIKGLYD